MYPLNLNMVGRSCCVVGGGKVALRKIRSLVAAGALVTVVAPMLLADLAELYKSGDIGWRREKYQTGCLKGYDYFMIFCATDSKAVNEQAAREAKQLGIIVNCVSNPELCDFTVPASVHQGDLLLTVSTGGGSPAFSRLLRQELEKRYNEYFGKWLAIQARLRQELKDIVDDSQVRESFWRQQMNQELLELIAAGKLQQAEDEITNGINSFRAKS